MRAPETILLVVLAATALRAHPEIEAGLARLNAALATQPGNADLYLERGNSTRGTRNGSTPKPTFSPPLNWRPATPESSAHAVHSRSPAASQRRQCRS